MTREKDLEELDDKNEDIDNVEFGFDEIEITSVEVVSEFVDEDENDESNESEEKEVDEDKVTEKREHSSLESILYKIPRVENPLIGTPKDVQKQLDAIALKIQKKPNSAKSDLLYNKIHLFMHSYLINVAVRQFPYIKGLQTTDIYQESLIALRFKAIPNFQSNKGMSFLNFAKMCIRRHLITLLNTSKKRKKDQSMNSAISIDAPVSDDDSSTISSTLQDKAIAFDKLSERKEAFEFTKNILMKDLSDFERQVLDEYLTNSSYKEIAKNIARKTNKRCFPKAVDNALLRIRKKALLMLETEHKDNLPMFL